MSNFTLPPPESSWIIPPRAGGEGKFEKYSPLLLWLYRYIVKSLNRYIVNRPISIVQPSSSIVHRPSSIVNRQSSIVHCPSSIVNRQSSIANRQSSIVISSIVNSYIVISLSHLKYIVQVTGPWLKRRILISRCSPGVVARIHSKLNLPHLPFPL